MLESSSEGRLGLKNIYIEQWKGKTFNQVFSIIKKNNVQQDISNKHLLKSLPLKIHRREICSTNGNARNSQSITLNYDLPGGTIIRENSDCNMNVQEINKNIKYEDPCSEGHILENESNSKNLNSLNQQTSALRRVRSSGMQRNIASYSNTHSVRSANESCNISKDSFDKGNKIFSSAREYMYNRNKTFQQNSFNRLRSGVNEQPGSANTYNNVYSSNNVSHCTNDSYVKVHYNPSNSKFSQNGAVSSGTRLLRLKTDTIREVSSKMESTFGKQTANAMAKGIQTYTLKDKIGFPNKCTPCFTPSLA